MAIETSQSASLFAVAFAVDENNPPQTPLPFDPADYEVDRISNAFEAISLHRRHGMRMTMFAQSTPKLPGKPFIYALVSSGIGDISDQYLANLLRQATRRGFDIAPQTSEISENHGTAVVNTIRHAATLHVDPQREPSP